MANNYLHPNVESQIIDTSEIVSVVESDITLFACLTSDQGPDNQVTDAYSPSDFINKFGNPNFEKHGQTAYNVINWLTAGGNAKIIRVTPSDAGYANIFLSLQSKFEFEVDGTTVKKANIRPTLYYTNNNSTVSELESELDNENETLDGFKENVILGFYPNGRGKVYNDLAVSLTLNDKYSDTYDFRLYDLVFYSVNTDGDLVVLESYLVSLDSTAQNLAGESMFVKTVVEKNSSVFRVLFNKDVLDKLAEKVNPYVNAKTLDLISGVQNIYQDEPVTYVPNGSTTTVNTHAMVSIASIDDANKSYIELDNTLRLQKVSVYKDKLEQAQENVRRIGRNTFIANYDVKMTDMTNKISPLETAVSAVLTAIKKLNDDDTFDRTVTGALKDLTEKNLKADAEYTSLETAVNNAKTLAESFLASAYVVGNNTNSITRLEIGSALSLLVEQYEKLNAIGLKKESKVVLMNLVSTVIKTISEGTTATLASEVVATLDKLTSTIDMLPGLDSTVVLQYTELGSVINVTNHSDYVALIQTQFNTVKDTFNTINNDRFATAEEKADAITTTTTDLNGILVLCKEYLAVIELFIKADYLLDVAIISGKTIAALGTDSVAETQAILSTEKRAYIVSNTGKAELTSDEGRAVVVADEIEIEYQAAAGQDYVLTLAKPDAENRFKKGTDGSIDYVPSNLSNRRTVIAALLTAGYSGLIDPSVTDKKLVKFTDMMDACYPAAVKNAMVKLSSEVRKDCFVFLDLGASNLTPDQAVKYKVANVNFNTPYAAIYGASVTVDDTLYSKNDIEVTPTYFLSAKVPFLQNQYGIHYPLAGMRRGTLDTVKYLSFSPNANQKESLYRAQINYIEQDPRTTKLATQITSQKKNSAMSRVNNVRTALKIQTDVESLMEEFLQEFNDDGVISSANAALSNYLNTYITRGMVASISGIVYSTPTEAKEGTIRVKIELQFKNIIERVKIDIFVK